jgi:hypothetical protein
VKRPKCNSARDEGWAEGAKWVRGYAERFGDEFDGCSMAFVGLGAWTRSRQDGAI